MGPVDDHVSSENALRGMHDTTGCNKNTRNPEYVNILLGLLTHIH